MDPGGLAASALAGRPRPGRPGREGGKPLAAPGKVEDSGQPAPVFKSHLYSADPGAGHVLLRTGVRLGGGRGCGGRRLQPAAVRGGAGRPAQRQAAALPLHRHRRAGRSHFADCRPAYLPALPGLYLPHRHLLSPVADDGFPQKSAGLGHRRPDGEGEGERPLLLQKGLVFGGGRGAGDLSGPAPVWKSGGRGLAALTRPGLGGKPPLPQGKASAPRRPGVPPPPGHPHLAVF